MLTLYYLPVCPSCRSVLMLGQELGITLELKHVNLKGKEHMTPEFLAMNPGHTVPVLVDDATKLTLFESRAIMGYLVDKYSPDHSLYPRDPVMRSEIDKWLYYNCGTLQPAGRPVIKPIISGKDPEAGAFEGLKDSLQVVEKMIELRDSHKFLTGDVMTIADLDLLITIDFAVGLADLDLSPYPRVNAWFGSMTSLPYYEEISGSHIRKTREMLDRAKAGN